MFFTQPSGLHLADDGGANGEEDSRFPGAMDDARLARLQDEVRALRQWLTYVSHSTGGMDKRYKPSGFLGSRGKRFIPGLESLLLARYYKGKHCFQLCVYISSSSSLSSS